MRCDLYNDRPLDALFQRVIRVLPVTLRAFRINYIINLQALNYIPHGWYLRILVAKKSVVPIVFFSFVSDLFHTGNSLGLYYIVSKRNLLHLHKNP